MAADGGQPGAEAPARQTEPREEESGKAQATSASPLLRELGAYVVRALLCLAPVYLAGYLGLSTSWVLIGLLLWMWWRRNRRDKRSRLLAAFGLVEDEKEAIARGIALHQLPAWVHFPDVERVEWLNKVLEQAWPYFGEIIERKFKDVIEPKIRAKNVHLKTCTFTKVNFGDKVIARSENCSYFLFGHVACRSEAIDQCSCVELQCPKIKGVKTYTKEVDRRQVILDVQICYIGDCEIQMELSKLNVGVKGVQFYGTLRVILEPLMSHAPFFGAVTMFFIQKPHLEISWAGLTNLLDAPGIR
ncbi:hypothetical protein lerEdw1_014195 [Lerista edwardsae]|nr:hypothetical protein lerEdw1_014196 [Lerista edwardsae]KAJ6634011.1 hypothetical protein lerEdw1_014195 [Lerista edwardsae]